MDLFVESVIWNHCERAGEAEAGEGRQYGAVVEGEANLRAEKEDTVVGHSDGEEEAKVGPEVRGTKGWSHGCGHDGELAREGTGAVECHH